MDFTAVVYLSEAKNPISHPPPPLYALQGADDKLGQFQDQDIEASHRNVFAALFEKPAISGFT